MSYGLWWIMDYEVMDYDLFNCTYGKSLLTSMVKPGPSFLVEVEDNVAWKRE